MSHDPFDTLLDIEQKCRTYAKPLPSQKAIGRMWQGIGFMSADVHYVAPLNEIKEVLLLPEFTGLPSGVGWFRGVSNLRGHLLPITDLQSFMSEIGESSQNKTALTSLSRILVIDFEGSSVGFLVQQVFGIQRFSEDLFETHPENLDEVQEFNDGKVVWRRLSLQALSQMPSFNHIVKQMVT